MKRKAYLCLSLIFAFFFIGSFLLLVELTESKDQPKESGVIYPTTTEDVSGKKGQIY